MTGEPLWELLGMFKADSLQVYTTTRYVLGYPLYNSLPHDDPE